MFLLIYAYNNIIISCDQPIGAAKMLDTAELQLPFSDWKEKGLGCHLTLLGRDVNKAPPTQREREAEQGKSWGPPYEKCSFGGGARADV